ncbi:uncharacterized protein F5Z01DRAFT_408093 [Emericellopsis atlantica]|uniref:AGC-kinase C-terminal domain-containing protein n=1 Tax=Emericellopsis atlantica TaxID=2614577 RepID=A0A9P7ZSQ6_9HYPO|nr:uncharacterized protein F5Z01DRAFT_408093 [Emericellopsis atlantica]KAG9257633.1 hypothetical protein F5Z01DRAFT_408093 [Emericellopsis atlantica]
MLSHLKFHRWGSSAPSSPVTASAPKTPGDNNQLQRHESHQSQHQQLDSAQLSPQPSSGSSMVPPVSATSSNQNNASPALPPTLPEIVRVASPELDPTDRKHHNVAASEATGSSLRTDGQKYSSQPQQNQNAPALPRSPYEAKMDSGFIGGVALRNYKRKLQAQHKAASSQRETTEMPPASNLNSASNSNSNDRRQETQSRPSLRQRPVPAPINTNTGPTRPPPQVLHHHSYGPHMPSSSFTFVAPTDAEKPTSSQGLTGRRPAGARVPSDPAPTSSTSPNMAPPEPHKSRKGLPFLKSSMSSLLARRKHAQQVAEQLPRPSETEQPTYDPRIRGTRVHDFSAPRRKGFSSESRENLRQSGDNERPSVPPKDSKSLSPDSMLVRGSSGASVVESVQRQPEEDAAVQRQRSIPQRQESSSSSRYSDRTETAPAPTTRSRNISISSEMSMGSRLSGIPKHMKSTSSRFSFDMIGAAKQEKLLEERHRQREAEKKVSDSAMPRDSRFDDFDDDFDYDAMMDDDGLEERIPGVNADYDEEDNFYIGEDDVVGDDEDPDNDQENFAGFSFQRSNGTSPLIPSPGNSGLVGTPQPTDEAGDDQFLSPPRASPAGLGIQGAVTSNEASTKVEPQEDLYYEDDFAEDLARPPSWEGAPFDESIFDINDTDSYGRPIAGAFAQAKSDRQAALDEAAKRESDMTSRLSAQSEVVHQSTAHTSVSQAQPSSAKIDESGGSDTEATQTAHNTMTQDQNPMAAYQAALAAAAHAAAATGKFKWEQSRSESQVLAPKESVEEEEEEEELWQLSHDVDDDSFGYEDMDDFELDDGFVAEANAEALASDSDGWYGQEFGFYSAPVSGRDSKQGPSDKAAFMYANGGFFGPKDGLSRSKSGRVVSQEPNLTPITERSEYSNRNSVMSMAMPGFALGTPVQSPGLAQLTMMADRGDEMSLSALLRLRNKAWGGSQASLASSREGSPRSERGDAPSSPWTAQWNGHPHAHVRKGSLISGMGLESDANANAGSSPTVTAPAMSSSAPVSQGRSYTAHGPRLSASSQPENRQHQAHAGKSPDSTATSSCYSPAGSNVSPSLSRRSEPGHKHGNSADSISYTREDDSGEGRWVVERRRVDESGQVATAREVVEGGRI